MHWMNPKWLRHVWGLKVQICILHAHWRPRFSHYGESVTHLSVTAQFAEKSTEWPQNDLEMFEIKETHAPGTQIFISFTPTMSCFSSYDPILGKSALNDLKMTLTCSKSKAPVCIPRMPLQPKFSSNLLWWAIFKLRPSFKKRAMCSISATFQANLPLFVRLSYAQHATASVNGRLVPRVRQVVFQ